MEQTLGVAIDQGGRERSGREKWFKSYNVLVNQYCTTFFKTFLSILYVNLFKLHALQVAKPAKPVAHMMEVSLSILMGSVNIFAQQKDIVGMETLTKLVMTVVDA